MAFCGVVFEEKSPVDHSLKNVVAFSTSRGQLSVTSSEGLFQRDENDKPKDRRILIEFNKEKYLRTSYWEICQLTFKIPRQKAVGSGIMINGKNLESRALSCAHNFIAVSLKDKKITQFKEHLLYKSRYGEKSWRYCWKLDEQKVLVHPKYDGTSACGFDIATCQLSLKLGSSNYDKDLYIENGHYRQNIDTIWNFANPKSIEKGMRIEICGYPGEKEGFPYTHTGEITDVTETNLGGHVLWYNLDTTPGNSGSAIMITDKTWISKEIQTKKKNGQCFDKIIIGVHTGTDLATGTNFGTLITKPIQEWIYTGVINESVTDQLWSYAAIFFS